MYKKIMKKLSQLYISLFLTLGFLQAGFLQATKIDDQETDGSLHVFNPLPIKYRTINYEGNPREIPNIHAWHQQAQRSLDELHSLSGKNLAKFRVVITYEGEEEKSLDFVPYIFLSGGKASEDDLPALYAKAKELGWSPITMEENFGTLGPDEEKVYEYRKEIAGYFKFAFKTPNSETAKREESYFAALSGPIYTEVSSSLMKGIPKTTIENRDNNKINKIVKSIRDDAKGIEKRVRERISNLFKVVQNTTSFDDESNNRAKFLFNGKTADEVFEKFVKDFYDSEQVIRKFILIHGYAVQSESSPLKKLTKDLLLLKERLINLNAFTERLPVLNDDPLAFVNNVDTLLPSLKLELSSLQANLEKLMDERNLGDYDPYISFKRWEVLLPATGKRMDTLTAVRMEIATTRHMCDMCYTTYEYDAEERGHIIKAILNGILTRYKKDHPEEAALTPEEIIAGKNLKLKVITSGVYEHDKDTWLSPPN